MSTYQKAFIDWFKSKCPGHEYILGWSVEGALYIESLRDGQCYYFEEYYAEVIGLKEPCDGTL